MYIIIIYVHLFILQGWHGVGVLACPTFVCRIAVSHASYLPNTVVTRHVSFNPIDYFRVSSPLSTGYGPRPDAIDDFSRQLPLFLRPRSSESSPSDLASFIPYICPTSI